MWAAAAVAMWRAPYQASRLDCRASLSFHVQLIWPNAEICSDIWSMLRDLTPGLCACEGGINSGSLLGEDDNPLDARQPSTVNKENNSQTSSPILPVRVGSLGSSSGLALIIDQQSSIAKQMIAHLSHDIQRDM